MSTQNSKCGRCFVEIKKSVHWHAVGRDAALRVNGWDTIHCWGDTEEPEMLHSPDAPNLATDPMGRKWLPG